MLKAMAGRPAPETFGRGLPATSLTRHIMDRNDAGRPAARCGRAQPLHAHHAAARARRTRLRAGRSDPGAGAGAGPHAASSRGRLPRRRSRAPLCQPRRPRGLLRELRLRHRRRAGVDAPARRSRALDRGARAGTCVRCWTSSGARRGASARSRRALRARDRHQLLGRLVERDDAPAGCHALPRACCGWCVARRDPDLRRARARGRAGATPPRAARISTRSSTSSSASTRRCRRRACRSW